MESRTGERQKAHDPVCNMDVFIDEARGSSNYMGMTYYFCCQECKEEFDRDPERFGVKEGMKVESKVSR